MKVDMMEALAIIAKHENMQTQTIDSQSNAIRVGDYLRNTKFNTIGRVVSWTDSIKRGRVVFAFTVQPNIADKSRYLWYANDVELYKCAADIPQLCDAPIGIDKNGTEIFEGDTIIHIASEHVTIGKACILECFPAIYLPMDDNKSPSPSDYEDLINFRHCVLYERAKKEE